VAGFVGSLSLHGSAATGNVAAGPDPHGGGIFRSSGTVTLVTTVVAGNTPDNCEPTIAGC
jgi:hypothetical protein